MVLVARSHEPGEELCLFLVCPVFRPLPAAVHVSESVCILCYIPSPLLGGHLGVGLLALEGGRGDLLDGKEG